MRDVNDKDNLLRAAYCVLIHAVLRVQYQLVCSLLHARYVRVYLHSVCRELYAHVHAHVLVHVHVYVHVCTMLHVLHWCRVLLLVCVCV